MLEVDHDKIILLFTPFPTIPMLATIVVVMLICSMLELSDHVVLYCIVRMHLQGLYQHVIPRNVFAYKVILLLIISTGWWLPSCTC